MKIQNKEYGYSPTAIWELISIDTIDTIEYSINNYINIDTLKNKVKPSDFDNFQYGNYLNKYAYNYLMYKITKQKKYLYTFLKMYIDYDEIYNPYKIIQTLTILNENELNNKLKYLILNAYLEILYNNDQYTNEEYENFIYWINQLIKQDYIKVYKILGDYNLFFNNACLAFYYYEKSNFYNLDSNFIQEIYNLCKKETSIGNI